MKMYNDITIKIDSNDFPWPIRNIKPFWYNDIQFIPSFNYSGVFTSYIGNIKNLYLKLMPGSLTIRNSIHKFIQGNNYSDLTLSDVNYFAEYFTSNYGINIKDAEVKKLSYAVNIEVPDPDEIYKGMISYKSRPFEPMKKNNRIYGARFTGAEFRIKAYNKTTEVKLHDKENIPQNIFRFETEIKVMRSIQKKKINPIPVYRYRDLYDYNCAKQLMDDLIVRYQTILKIPSIRNAKLTIKDLRLIAMFSNPECVNYCKENLRGSYKKDRPKLNEINKDKLNHILFEEVEQRIRQKSEEILSC